MNTIQAQTSEPKLDQVELMKKFTIAELKASSSVIEICSTWFTSANAGEIIITNPEDAPFRFKFKFKTPDLLEQTAIQDNKVVNTIMLERMGETKK